MPFPGTEGPMRRDQYEQFIAQARDLHQALLSSELLEDPQKSAETKEQFRQAMFKTEAAVYGWNLERKSEYPQNTPLSEEEIKKRKSEINPDSAADRELRLHTAQQMADKIIQQHQINGNVADHREDELRSAPDRWDELKRGAEKKAGHPLGKTSEDYRTDANARARRETSGIQK